MSSPDQISAALDYLTIHDLGVQGSTLAFETHNAGGVTTDTYVYSQTATTAGSAGGFSLVKLAGFEASTGISSDPSNHLVTTVHIE